MYKGGEIYNDIHSKKNIICKKIDMPSQVIEITDTNFFIWKN